MYKRLVAFTFALALVFPFSVSAAQFETNLRYGQSKNVEVTKLQEFLTDQGLYTGPISGNFFSLTLKAVKAFQVSKNVVATGYFGPVTRTKANDVIALALADSDVESVNEPAVVVPKTTDDVVTKLNDQLSASKLQSDQLAQQLASQSQILGQQSQLLSNIVSNTAPVVSAPVVVVEPAQEIKPAPRVWDEKHWYWGAFDMHKYPNTNQVMFSFLNFSTNTLITVNFEGQVKTAYGRGFGQNQIFIDNVNYGIGVTHTYTISFEGDDVGSGTFTNGFVDAY